MALRRSRPAEGRPGADDPIGGEDPDSDDARTAKAACRHAELADALLGELDLDEIQGALARVAVPALADASEILVTDAGAETLEPQLRVPAEGLPAVAFRSVAPLADEARRELRDLAETTLREVRLWAQFQEQVEMRATLEHSLLPEALLPVPGLQLASRYLPAAMGQQVGGDFYDAVRTGDGTVLIVGDVQGKGVEAATLTSLARHTLRAGALEGAGPAEMLAQLNRALLYGQAEQKEAGSNAMPRFVTAAVAALTPADDGFDVVLARGGQPPPLVVRWSGDIELFEPAGVLLGVTEDPTFELARTHLGPSDTLVLYTDGVTEQRSPETAFDENQLGLLVRHRLEAIDADAIAQAILDTVMLVAPEGSRDDIAILVASPSARPPDEMLQA
ncbi:MAG: hypothetical protein QOF97_2771 [Acidimicrobiaceae bacterium]